MNPEMRNALRDSSLYRNVLPVASAHIRTPENLVINPSPYTNSL